MLQVKIKAPPFKPNNRKIKVSNRLKSDEEVKIFSSMSFERLQFICHSKFKRVLLAQFWTDMPFPTVYKQQKKSVIILT